MSNFKIGQARGRFEITRTDYYLNHPQMRLVHKHLHFALILHFAPAFCSIICKVEIAQLAVNGTPVNRTVT